MTTTPDRETLPTPPAPPDSAADPAGPDAVRAGADGTAPDVRPGDGGGPAGGSADAESATNANGREGAAGPGAPRAAADASVADARGGDLTGGPATQRATQPFAAGAPAVADYAAAVSGAAEPVAAEDVPVAGGPGDSGGSGGGDGSGGGGGQGGDRGGAPGGPGVPGGAVLAPRAVPRWARWLVVPVLILVPLVYMLISAEQSRGAGVDSQKQAAARHLTWLVPSELQRRIYQVPIPDGTAHDGYLETNSWNVSTFYCQFTTTAGGLDTFLADLGTSRAALHEGKVTITPQDAGEVGWNFTVPRHHWAGLSTHKVGDKPDHDITVDLTHADAPVVYVVSTVNFQHGLGDGWIRRIVK